MAEIPVLACVAMLSGGVCLASSCCCCRSILTTPMGGACPSPIGDDATVRMASIIFNRLLLPVEWASVVAADVDDSLQLCWPGARSSVRHRPPVDECRLRP